MKHAEVTKEVNKIFDRIGKVFDDLLDEFEPEVIHSFRVEIKKLRAFTSLLNLCLPADEQLEISGRLQDFYHATGNIRNVQLHQTKLDKLCLILPLEAPTLYLSRLHGEESFQKQNARQIGHDLPLRHYRKKFSHGIPERAKTVCADEFVSHTLAGLQKLLAIDHYSDENLHGVRKLLKSLQYNRSYIDNGPNTLLRYYFASFEELKLMAGMLGDFHDLCTASYFFGEAFVGQITSEKEIVVIQLLEAHLQKSKRQMKSQICEVLLKLRAAILSKTVTIPG